MSGYLIDYFYICTHNVHATTCCYYFIKRMRRSRSGLSHGIRMDRLTPPEALDLNGTNLSVCGGSGNNV